MPIDFKNGLIVYNEFHFDFNKPFSEQVDFLTEDLLQVEYSNGYIIDLGWYPEFDINGEFTVQVIRNSNWEKPIYKRNIKDCKELKKSLIKAVAIATESERTANTFRISIIQK